MHKLANIAVLIVLIALAPAAPLPIGLAARAQDANATAPIPGPAGAPVANPDPASTAVSGLDVVAHKTVTEVDGLDVVVTRKTSTEVSEVEVRSPQTCLPPRSPVDEETPAPKLVSTYPANGQAVQPGYLVLRLTFDLPMACRGSLPGNLLTACLSDGIELWHESFDRRSLVIACNLKPNSHYELNVKHRMAEPFQGLSGQYAEEALFSFDTSGEPPVTTADAMIQRDGSLVAMLRTAGPDPRASDAVAEPEAGVLPAAAKVSTLKVQETNRCLQPRDPPDRDVPAPKLVSTFPAQNQTVRPGLTELRFTYDLPMACTGGVTVVKGAITVKGIVSDPCTDGVMDQNRTQHLNQPWDRHSLRFRCRLEPGTLYVVSINRRLSDRVVDWPAFQSLGGQSAAPYELTFTTSQDTPVQTQADADDEDPLIAMRLDGQDAHEEP